MAMLCKSPMRTKLFTGFSRRSKIDCKGGRHGGEDVTSVDAFADDKSGYDFLWLGWL